MRCQNMTMQKRRKSIIVIDKNLRHLARDNMSYEHGSCNKSSVSLISDFFNIKETLLIMPRI